MALWLYWLFYAAALGTATCYAAYKAALVQRTLAAVARRGLRGLVHDITDDSKGCTVTRTESGALVKASLACSWHATCMLLTYVLLCTYREVYCLQVCVLSMPPFQTGRWAELIICT